jgi:hypothetical protein
LEVCRKAESPSLGRARRSWFGCGGELCSGIRGAALAAPEAPELPPALADLVWVDREAGTGPWQQGNSPTLATSNASVFFAIDDIAGRIP